MRKTVVISDLHLGSSGGIDLLRRADIRETLWAELEAADEVVLLGDAIELRDRPLSAALEAARPFFDELGSVVGEARVLIVPGNHDYHLLNEWLERRRLDQAGALGLEQRIPLGSAGPLAELTKGMGKAQIELTYPGVWLREDVYATHGHYMDRHLTVPTFERLAVAAVERILGGAKEATADEPGESGEPGSAMCSCSRWRRPARRPSASAAPTPPRGCGRRLAEATVARRVCAAGCSGPWRCRGRWVSPTALASGR